MICQACRNSWHHHCAGHCTCQHRTSGAVQTIELQDTTHEPIRSADDINVEREDSNDDQ